MTTSTPRRHARAKSRSATEPTWSVKADGRRSSPMASCPRSRKVRTRPSPRWPALPVTSNRTVFRRSWLLQFDFDHAHRIRAGIGCHVRHVGLTKAHAPGLEGNALDLSRRIREHEGAFGEHDAHVRVLVRMHSIVADARREGHV